MSDIARWHEFTYEQTDIPAGMTIHDWRLQRETRTRRRLYRRLRKLIRIRRCSSAIGGDEAIT